MPRRSYDRNRIERHNPGVLKFHLHFGKCSRRICEDMLSRETQVPDVVSHVEECDRAGPSLRRIKPISGISVVADIRIATPPDIKPVQRVVGDRNPDAEQFQKENKWK